MRRHKPLDAETLHRAAVETRLVPIIEDLDPEGGIGEAVAAVLAETPMRARFAHLAVRTTPGSTTTTEALEAAGISAARIAATVCE